jgi:hypothetical protein
MGLAMTLNTHYKIPEITFNNLCAAISKLGFDAAFKIAFERALAEIRENPNSIIIAELLSWSHHLGRYAADATDENIRVKYMDAAAFCRKLAHHVYWAAESENLVERSPHFIQAVK